MKEVWMLLTPWKKFKLIMSLLLIAYVVIFAIINWQFQSLNFIFFKLEIPMTLLVFVCLGVGYLFSTLFDYKKFKAKDAEIERLSNRIKELENKS